LRFPVVACLCLAVLAPVQRVMAQQDPGRSGPVNGPWQPIGELPADQTGGGRGYALAGEGATVADPGTSRIAVHLVAANYFYREQNADYLITQRYESHTAALDFRRGFKAAHGPRFELGAQVQFSERDGGFLNGVIASFESLSLSVSGVPSAKNELRTLGTPLPLGAFLTRNGRAVYAAPGGTAGIGDVSVVAKALLLDAPPGSRGTRLAARVGMNISGKSQFAEGHFVGVGVGFDSKVLSWAAVHGDVRATVALDRTSGWNLPLKRTTVGFSIGPELRLSRGSSLSMQLDGNTTPYLPTGTTAFDRGYGSITIGAGHRFGSVVSQLYVRENMNLPFRVRWNTEPDASFGIKISFRPH